MSSALLGQPRASRSTASAQEYSIVNLPTEHPCGAVDPRKQCKKYRYTDQQQYVTENHHH